MSTPHGESGEPGGAGNGHGDMRPAPLDRQIATALDSIDKMMDTVEGLAARVATLERGGGDPGTNGTHYGITRSAFRFHTYAPDDPDDRDALQKAVRRTARSWQTLHDWVDWLVATYRLHQLIPACWPEHPQLVEELIGLCVSWTAAWSDDGPADAIVTFHERLYRARDRWLDQNWGNYHRDGHHDPRGIDDAGNYHTWAHTRGRDAALRAARDRSIAALQKAPHPRHLCPAASGDEHTHDTAEAGQR